MSSSKIVAVLGALLLAGFFLPWVTDGDSKTGFQSAMIWWESDENRVLGIILFLAPVGALLALILGATGRAHGLVAFFTGLIVPALAALAYLGSDADQASHLGNTVSYGFWITIVASVLLLLFSFTKSDSKLRARRL